MYNIFIYSGGKCGSSTLFNTFINNNYTTIHLHNNDYYKEIYNSETSIFELIDSSSLKYNYIYIIDSYELG